MPTGAGRDQIKDWLTRRAPLPYLWAREAVGRLYEVDVRRVLLHRCRGIVRAGPFAGMHYIDRSSCGPLSPRLLGLYERELHEVVRRIVGTPYDRVIVVGSAEGYYAVGLARAMPGVIVQAYDIDAQARANLRELAILNGTDDRTIIEGECTHAELERFAREAVVVVCDIEGGELDLLDPALAPSLRHYDVLVEMHDRVGSTTVRRTVTDRFAATHDVRIIAHVPAVSAPAALLPWWFSRRARRLALDEYRAPPAGAPDARCGLEWGVFFARDPARGSRATGT